jgi:hypothetical protein
MIAGVRGQGSGVRVFGMVVALSTTAYAQRPDPSSLTPNPSIQYGLTKSKDTVTVGEPFEVRLRVRAPAGSRIRFPENPDSAGMVQALDPRTIVTTDSVNAVDQTAIYRLAAWDIGDQPISIGNVTVGVENAPTAAERPVNLAALGVYVRSVLPADSAQRVPKPARPLWEAKAFPWWILALILGLIGAGLLAWWWWRRRRQPQPEVVVDPYDRARREFNRIEAMGLLDAGERTRFAALVVEVLRDYFAVRYAEAGLALTSRELLAVLRRQPAVPIEQLSRVLHEADLAKFANWALAEERARSLARDARAVVEYEHKASQPEPIAERAA